MNEMNIDRLEKYLNGQLNEDEKKSLEAALRTDSQLQQELNDLRLLRIGIEQAGRHALLSDLKTIESKLAAVEKPVIPIWRNTYWRAVAAILIMAALVFVFIPKKMNEQELFAENFTPYPNVIMPTVRGEQQPDTSLLSIAYHAYDRNEFDIAIKSFESVREKDATVFLYLGNCYLAINNPETAKIYFEKAIETSDVFYEQATWFLALTYLKQNDIRNARIQLEKLISGQSSYIRKAKHLLDNL